MDSYERLRAEKLISFIEKYELEAKSQAELAEKIAIIAKDLKGYLNGKEVGQKLNKDNIKTIIIPDMIKSQPERHNPYIEKLINKINTGFEAEEKEVKDIPPQYRDGSFRKRGKLLEYRFIHIDNQTKEKQLKSVYGQSEQECFDKRTEIIAGKRKKAKTKQDLTKKQLLLGEWLNEWYNTFRRHKQSAKSQQLAESHIKYIGERFGNMPLKKISGIELQEFLNGYNDRTNTQDKLLKMLRASFKKAMLLKHIKENPCEVLEITPHRYQHYNVLQPAEQNKLFANIQNTKYLRLFKFCCCTGLRIGEALAVKTSDFDPINGIISIKGIDTKTKKHVRQIPYLPELIDLPQGDELFPDITHNSVKLYFKRLFKELDIKAVIHSFRHTFISCCYHIGFKDKQIQLYAGHANIAMTLDTYTHILKNQTSPIIEYLKKLKTFVDNN